jgi:hypothetical protein
MYGFSRVPWIKETRFVLTWRFHFERRKTTMLRSRKNILVVVSCLAVLLLGGTNLAYGYASDCTADALSVADQGPTHALATESSGTNSATAESIVRGYTSLGSYNHTLGDAEATSHTLAQRQIFLEVTSPGTMSYDLSLDGILTVGPAAGHAYVGFATELDDQQAGPFGDKAVPGTKWGGEAYLDIVSGQYIYKTIGNVWGDTTTYPGTSSVEATFPTIHVVTPSLDVGEYVLYMSLYGGAQYNGESDFYHSLGFGDTNADFWDIVGGTASFYDRDDPSKNHSPVPLPGTLFLLGSGLLALGRCGWRQQNVSG